MKMEKGASYFDTNSIQLHVDLCPYKSGKGPAQQPRRRLSQYLFWWRVGGVAKHLARHINYSLYLCKYLCKFIEYIDNIDNITYRYCNNYGYFHLY